MMKKLIIFIFSLYLSAAVLADVRLPKLISDGMILQRDQPVLIWGWADPGEKIQVVFHQKRYKTKTSPDGKWEIKLDKQAVGGPFKMTIQGDNYLEINDILIGDVWLCSGQSNMELPMRRVKPLYSKEIEAAENSEIRFFTIPQKYNFKAPKDDLDGGNWQKVNRQNIEQFSAVAYFFASDLYERYQVPIGILNASLGGSPIEAWMSEEALRIFPESLNEGYKWRNDKLITQTEANDFQTSRDWYAKANQLDAGLKGLTWHGALDNDTDWNAMKIPGYWKDENRDFNQGIYWFRKSFRIDPADAGKPAELNLGRIVDADSVFVNGKFIGTTSYQYPPRWYNIPKDALKEGDNLVVVRVVSNAGKGGFVPDKPYYIKTLTNRIDLKGEWKFKKGCDMQPLPGQTFVRWKPMGLYNAMIAPLNFFAKKGMLWYQGESNTNQPEAYTKLLKTMILDWRKKSGQRNLPFVYAQLPNFMEQSEQPAESNWAAFREAQRQVLQVKNTAMAVTIDLGEWNDIHPLNKKDLAKRLAKLAATLAYKDPHLISSAPEVTDVKAVQGEVWVSFEDNSISTRDGNDPREFALAGTDGKYFRAQAKIENGKIRVWCPEVSMPVKVRYAWADNPQQANLTDTTGNFVSPFQLNVK